MVTHKHRLHKYTHVPVALTLKPSTCVSPPYSKAADLEEELKNVTNNLKSLEAQSEKVRVSVMCSPADKILI